jgi:hypothetical protein
MRKHRAEPGPIVPTSRWVPALAALGRDDNFERIRPGITALDWSLEKKRKHDMALREQINDSLKEAMKAKDQKRVNTLRLVNAALKDKDIAARTETSRDLLGDDEILSLLAKMIKQREDSIAAYVAGNRPELAQAERDEIAIIRGFMPKQMSLDEAKVAIAAVIADVGAASIKDMGKVMAALKERYAGQMDFGKASGAVKEALTPK